MLRSTAFLLLGVFSAMAQMRPPAVPLVAHDPYFSIWSMADRLNGEGTKHWTGKPNTLTAYARIDGKSYRIMGRDRQAGNELAQTRLEVLPTRTIYEFAGAGLKVGLTFLTPALPDDLEVLSRPLTYIEWTVSSSDGKEHDVALYFDAGSELVVNTADQPVWSSRFQLDGQPVLRMGSREQPVLAKRGDDLRIDWGYLYLAADKPDGVTTTLANPQQGARRLRRLGPIARFRRAWRGAARRPGAGLGIQHDLGKVSHSRSRATSCWRMTIFMPSSISSGANGRGGGATARTAAGCCAWARRDHDALLERARLSTTELMADLRKAGGDKYAQLAVLAYRQTLAAHKLVADADGTALYFPKENFSNGCIATVDVIYPEGAVRAALQPAFAEGAASARARLRAHGSLALALRAARSGHVPAGQRPGLRRRRAHRREPDAGGGERQYADPAGGAGRVEGNADFAARYWPQVTKWAEYLKEKGLDPENQLSTDDFAGHLAHNANLSIKAILALGAYAQLAGMTGHAQEAARYRKIAQEFAGSG